MHPESLPSIRKVRPPPHSYSMKYIDAVSENQCKINQIYKCFAVQSIGICKANITTCYDIGIELIVSVERNVATYER